MADYSYQGHIFNVQSYCIHDGPGIRATVFVKGCPLNCLWCQNPESKGIQPQLMYYMDKCTGCGACYSACPQKAIAWKQGEKPRTDRKLCTACGICTEVCPAKAREITGYTATVEEVMQQVRADKLFMDGSGGGMTVSGGEPLMQPEFTANLLEAAHEEGINTAIETSNFASRQVIDRVYAHVDLAICDIKHMNSRIHQQLTGVPNEQILEHICYIRNVLQKPMNIRTPVVPGYNGDRENILATARFIKEKLGSEVIYSLLPYHRLGESKSESLELKDYELHVTPPEDAYMQELMQEIEQLGVKAHIGG